MTGATVTWRVSFGGRRRHAHSGDSPGSPVKAETPRVGPRRADAAARVARRLALAHHVEDLIERGLLRDHAHAAAVMGVSRPRMSQLVALLALSPALQERVLTGELACSEREVRRIAAEHLWDRQARLADPLHRHTHPDDGRHGGGR